MQKKTHITLDGLAVKLDGLAVTVDALARITANGFSRVDKRFDEMEKRFDDKLETVKEELQSDIASVNHLPERLEHRMDTLYDDMRLVKTKVGIR